MRKLIVCGGRDYRDRQYVFEVLDAIVAERPGEQVFVIHGAMSGVDWMAGDWASHRGHPCASVRALWTTYGRSAGPKRNRWMLMLAPDEVIAFPGGIGTNDMAKAADAAGVHVRVIKPRGAAS